jgi:type I restriction-modification system DNA methylase subunit
MANATPPAPIQPGLIRHRNHFLFSDYYLDNRVRDRPEWRAPDTASDVTAALAEIADLWRQFQPEHDNEAQTEDEWIRPVLRRLGHYFNVQVAVQTPLGARKPDYVFFPDEAARQAAKARTGVLSEADLRDALAVGDAKAWELPLDRAPRVKPGRDAPVVSENPSFQIDFYIRHTGLDWGILTNGRLWRLYHSASSKKLDVYYEVDLPALIEQNDPEAFRYFWLFFRRAAFGGEAGWLAGVLAESQAYEQGVSDNLKEQVYESLRSLAQGFLDFPENRLSPTPETLRQIHDNSLIVLYRLLFILYAESRGLLPVHENDAYTRSYSLHALKTRIARELQNATPAVSSMDTLWSQLRQLWGVLNSGNADLGVPAYNGGLFNADKHPFLEQYRVGDVHLRQAIDLLARIVDRATGQREFVDYRDLEVRHLGSIYEGLLEYQVRHTEVALAVQKERGREVYTPADAGSKPAVAAGQVYLATDKGERKATGSYYTPEYIVQYIVEHTVGPVLDELRAKHAGDEPALVGAILAVNVLDPSMGSGHFLVAAADYIARYLVALGLQTVDAPGSEGELAYWRRRVAQGCIYGVDLNPLAVELAKLSLWLATVARDRPLSFLDHHLRCGNSLIGARVRDLALDGAAPGKPKSKAKAPAKSKQQRDEEAVGAAQLSMLTDSAFVASMMTASNLMADIEALRGDTLDEVHEAERLYHSVSGDMTRKYRTLADVWTARYFGLDVDATLWTGLAAHILRGGFLLPQYAAIIDRAAQIASERRFFHWELEFPEVFFDRYGQMLEDEAGFDAVVGNPPYVRQEALGDVKGYFREEYAEVYHGTADIFVYFIGQGLRLLMPDRRLAYIASNSWLRANYATPLRHYLRSEAMVNEIVDLGDNRVFADAPDVYPAILVARNRPPASDHAAEAATFTRGEGLADFDRQVHAKLSRVAVHDQPDTGWQLGDDAGRRVLAKLFAGGRAFGEVVDGRLYRGVLTGLNEAFIIDGATRTRLVTEDGRSAEIIKPFLRGEDLRPWYQESEDRWVIFARRGIQIDDFPAGVAKIRPAGMRG